MLPLRDENPHPPGFKPKVTISLIIMNVVIFFYEVAVTGQIWEFSNQQAALMFFEWGAVPSCVTGFSNMIQPGISCRRPPLRHKGLKVQWLPAVSTLGLVPMNRTAKNRAYQC